MAIREILFYPDDVLGQEAEEIPEEALDSDEIQGLVEDLLDTVKRHRGLGLAAPQIGVSKRVCVARDQQGEYRVLVNPSLETVGEKTRKGPEGCLSIPGVQVEVERPEKVAVEYLTPEGETIGPTTLMGPEARIVQHEVDHLDGVLVLDHLSHLRRRRALKRYRKFRKRLRRVQ